MLQQYSNGIKIAEAFVFYLKTRLKEIFPQVINTKTKTRQTEIFIIKTWACLHV